MRFEGDLQRFPLALADLNALTVAEERCRVQVTHVTNLRQFGDWVAMTLRGVGEYLPSLGEMAALLSISPRTLNRYLEREGTTFQLQPAGLPEAMHAAAGCFPIALMTKTGSIQGCGDEDAWNSRMPRAYASRLSQKPPL